MQVLKYPSFPSRTTCSLLLTQYLSEYKNNRFAFVELDPHCPDPTTGIVRYVRFRIGGSRCKLVIARMKDAERFLRQPNQDDHAPRRLVDH